MSATLDTLTPRQINNRIKKELAVIEAQKNQKPVKEIVISIEWKKSRMWGYCPSATAEVHFQDGTFTRKDGYRAGGWGYDKPSTVIASVFNDFLAYKLYEKHKWKDRINGEETNFPYGVYYYGGKFLAPEAGHYYHTKPSFSHGVGVSCYYKIGEFIGGKFEQIANGKTFDVFKYSDGKTTGAKL